MYILFDQGTPVPLRTKLDGHKVSTAFDHGWQALANGDLIRAAEEAGFDALLTTDKNLKYQQNLTGRRIAIVVLPTTSWKKIQLNIDAIIAAMADLSSGSYVEVLFRR